MKMTQRETRPASRPTVLIAEDEASTRLFLQHQLDKAGFRPLPAKDGHEALSLLSDAVTVALIDLRMPDLSGIECIRRMRRTHPDVEPIVVTASSDIGDAVEAMKCGAFDYITKPVNVDELIESVRRASRTAELTQENRQLKDAISLPYAETPFIGTSASANRVMDMARKIGTLEGTVLISGESGVGKGLVARVIHNGGPQGTRPFVTVSCTALPRELVEAELFGHEKGAFTGAHERRPGRLEIADGGSLFLDEVGDMPLDLQPKLLTFLQERSFQRIGSNKTISVKVRVMAPPIKISRRSARTSASVKICTSGSTSCRSKSRRCVIGARTSSPSRRTCWQGSGLAPRTASRTRSTRMPRRQCSRTTGPATCVSSRT